MRRTWWRRSLERLVAIADSMNTLGGTGLWDEDGYYDEPRWATAHPFGVVVVGIVPLFAAEVLEDDAIRRLRVLQGLQWFLRTDDSREQIYLETVGAAGAARPTPPGDPPASGRAGARPPRRGGFLSHGVARCRSRDQPFVLKAGSEEHVVAYGPRSRGAPLRRDSNWRGPRVPDELPAHRGVRHHHVYGESFRVERPGSGH